MCLNVCDCVSILSSYSFLTKSLLGWILLELDHFKTPVKQSNSKAFPTPATSKKKLNFDTAHNLNLSAKKYGKIVFLSMTNYSFSHMVVSACKALAETLPVPCNSFLLFFCFYASGIHANIILSVKCWHLKGFCCFLSSRLYVVIVF